MSNLIRVSLPLFSRISRRQHMLIPTFEKRRFSYKILVFRLFLASLTLTAPKIDLTDKQGKNFELAEWMISHRMLPSTDHLQLTKENNFRVVNAVKNQEIAFVPKHMAILSPAWATALKLYGFDSNDLVNAYAVRQVKNQHIYFLAMQLGIENEKGEASLFRPFVQTLFSDLPDPKPEYQIEYAFIKKHIPILDWTQDNFVKMCSAVEKHAIRFEDDSWALIPFSNIVDGATVTVKENGFLIVSTVDSSILTIYG